MLSLCCLGKLLVSSIENNVIPLKKFRREHGNCLTCSPSKRLHPIGLWAFPLNCRESQTRPKRLININNIGKEESTFLHLLLEKNPRKSHNLVPRFLHRELAPVNVKGSGEKLDRK